MRLAASAKAGYYPINEQAVVDLVKHLYLKAAKPEKPNDKIQILDPCAGEGSAAKQIAEALGIPNQGIYTCELDKGRSEKILENIPGGNHIGPASYFGSQITGFSFGLAFVNPPFDFEYGGGRREEQSFVERAARQLCSHGVMVMVCPLMAFIGNRPFIEFFDSMFEEISIYKLSDELREYNEIVVFAKKRKVQLPSAEIYGHGELHAIKAQWTGYLTFQNIPPLGTVQPVWVNGNADFYKRETELRTYEVPRCWKPSTFKKTTHTDEELAAAIANSPLNKHIQEVKVSGPARPPLPLDKGHLGLILASGMLDGPVMGPHGVHIVRGSSHKVEYHNKEASKSEENPDTGAVTTTDVFSQKPVTVIRCVDRRGTIWTFSSESEEKLLEDDAHQEETGW